MAITSFQRRWIDISKHFGLSIQLFYEINLRRNTLTVPVLLQGFGAGKGMLLVTDYGLIRDVTDEIVTLGYGFSCLSEPSPGPIDWESVEEMLEEWGAKH